MCVGDQGFTFSLYCICIMYIFVHVHVCACVQYLQHDMMQHVCMSSLRMCLYFCMQNLQSAVLDGLGIHLLLSHPQTAPTAVDIISSSRGIYQTRIVAHVHLSPCIVLYIYCNVDVYMYTHTVKASSQYGTGTSIAWQVSA